MQNFNLEERVNLINENFLPKIMLEADFLTYIKNTNPCSIDALVAHFSRAGFKRSEHIVPTFKIILDKINDLIERKILCINSDNNYELTNVGKKTLAYLSAYINNNVPSEAVVDKEISVVDLKSDKTENVRKILPLVLYFVAEFGENESIDFKRLVHYVFKYNTKPTEESIKRLLYLYDQEGYIHITGKRAAKKLSNVTEKRVIKKVILTDKGKEFYLAEKKNKEGSFLESIGFGQNLPHAERDVIYKDKPMYILLLEAILDLYRENKETTIKMIADRVGVKLEGKKEYLNIMEGVKVYCRKKSFLMVEEYIKTYKPKKKPMLIGITRKGLKYLQEQIEYVYRHNNGEASFDFDSLVELLGNVNSSLDIQKSVINAENSRKRTSEVFYDNIDKKAEESCKKQKRANDKNIRFTEEEDFIIFLYSFLKCVANNVNASTYMSKVADEIEMYDLNTKRRDIRERIAKYIKKKKYVEKIATANNGKGQYFRLTKDGIARVEEARENGEFDFIENLPTKIELNQTIDKADEQLSISEPILAVNESNESVHIIEQMDYEGECEILAPIDLGELSFGNEVLADNSKEYEISIHEDEEMIENNYAPIKEVVDMGPPFYGYIDPFLEQIDNIPFQNSDEIQCVIEDDGGERGIEPNLDSALADKFVVLNDIDNLTLSEKNILLALYALKSKSTQPIMVRHVVEEVSKLSKKAGSKTSDESLRRTINQNTRESSKLCTQGFLKMRTIQGKAKMKELSIEEKGIEYLQKMDLIDKDLGVKALLAGKYTLVSNFAADAMLDMPSNSFEKSQ